ncbi:MAG: hypothetical protein SGILL_002058, partial [Bacillariaceae sp.]
MNQQKKTPILTQIRVRDIIKKLIKFEATSTCKVGKTYNPCRVDCPRCVFQDNTRGHRRAAIKLDDFSLSDDKKTLYFCGLEVVPTGAPGDERIIQEIIEALKNLSKYAQLLDPEAKAKYIFEKVSKKVYFARDHDRFMDLLDFVLANSGSSDNESANVSGNEPVRQNNQTDLSASMFAGLDKLTNAMLTFTETTDNLGKTTHNLAKKMGDLVDTTDNLTKVVTQQEIRLGEVEKDVGSLHEHNQKQGEANETRDKRLVALEKAVFGDASITKDAAPSVVQEDLTPALIQPVSTTPISTDKKRSAVEILSTVEPKAKKAKLSKEEEEKTKEKAIKKALEKAIRSYIRGSEDINRALHRCGGIKNLAQIPKEGMRSLITRIIEVLKDQPIYQGEFVYRAMDYKDEYIATLKRVGAIHHEAAFTSTSSYSFEEQRSIPEASKCFCMRKCLMTIKAKSGRDIGAFYKRNPNFKGEKEVLFPPGKDFRVIEFH